MILVVGANGMLGQDLTEILGQQSHGIDVDEIDITSPDSCSRAIRDLKPDTVVNCAAYTDVDGCETHKETAMQVNGEGVGNLARATKEAGALLVHVSTDYVFDGTKESPYVETDPPRPLNMYGRSKLAGETNAAGNPDHLIVRTQWLYGLRGKNFVETMLRLAGERDELAVVDDQTGSPTWTVDLSNAIIALIKKDRRGIYHAVNSGSCSWDEFARAIFQEEGLPVRVLPQTTEQLNRPALRPLNSRLDCGKLTADTGFCLRHWREALKMYLNMRKGL
jgi:dTDP-4-dehydrorhamnose reductase